MKYILTEDQLEKLIKASIKRHAKDTERNIEGGMFEYKGRIVRYTVTTRNDGYVFATYTYDETKNKVHVMSELDFIQLNKKEQENVVEHRIRKDIDKNY